MRRLLARLDAYRVVAAIDHRLVRLGMYKPDARRLVKLESLLAAVAIVAAVLFFLVGAVKLWHHNGGRGSFWVDLLGWIIWILYSIARIALVAAVLATIYQWFASRRGKSARS